MTDANELGRLLARYARTGVLPFGAWRRAVRDAEVEAVGEDE